MRSGRLVTFAAAVAMACSLAAGCAGKKDDGTALGQAQSEDAGDALSAGIEEGAVAFGPVDAGSAVYGSNACITLSGDTADTDGDNIPAAALLTFDCTETRLGFTGTVTGTETVSDDQPSTVAWAFTATANLESTLTGPAGASIDRSRNGQIVATQDSGVGPFHLDRTLDVSTVFVRANGQSATVTEAADWTLTFTPQVSWTPGQVVVTGTLSATGTWVITVGSREADATLSTPTPLTVNPSCASRITAGVLAATWEGDGATRTVTVTWSACGVYAVTYSEQ